jgi:hypothetical protein
MAVRTLPPAPCSSRCRQVGRDDGPLKYANADLAFAVRYTVGAGNVIVIGHSGITGNAGTDWPSQGQIDAADNFRFLMNCVAYLAAAAQKAG